MSDELVAQGQAALKAGDKVKARQLLQTAVQQDPRNETAWLWLAGAVDTDFERAIYLEKSLAINPNNAGARKALDRIHAALPSVPQSPETLILPVQRTNPVQPLQQPIQSRKRKKPNLLLSLVFALIPVIVTVGVVVGWYYFLGPCGKYSVNQANNNLMNVFSRWSDAVNVAESTSRVAISGPITDLQTIRQDAEKIKVPNCLKSAKESLIDSMNHVIDGFLAFSRQASDASVQKYFDQAFPDLDDFTNQMIDIKACAPFCK